MLWATLALLGVPIWLILGVLGGAYWNRRRFKQIPGVFRLKYKEALSEKWPRQATYGRWIHDVLLINKGIGLVPTTAVGVNSLTEVSKSETVKGFDDGDAVIFSLMLDDETAVQVAVASNTVSQIQGPFAKAD